MANTYVNTSTVTKAVQEAEKQPTNLFKMKKFLAVEPRTSTANPGYKPARRSQTVMRVHTRPNPVFGAR